jgi:hypothetical protein
VGTNLEQRRQAIAAALRKIMAEPLPATTAPVAIDEPVFLDEPTVAVEPARIDLRDEPDISDAEADVEPWQDDDEAAVADTHAVPPLEKVGSMSRVASLALFGHD